MWTLSYRQRLSACVLAALVGVSGCSTFGAEAHLPVFSQGLLNAAPGDQAFGSVYTPAARTGRRRHSLPGFAARRATALIGQRIRAPACAVAQAALLNRVFRRKVPKLRELKAVRHPSPGDLVLFRAPGDDQCEIPTRDAEPKVGVVVGVRGALVRYVYLNGQRARAGVLHLRRRGRRRVDGRTINSYVRKKRPDDPPRTAYLAGQLLKGFARVL